MVTRMKVEDQAKIERASRSHENHIRYLHLNGYRLTAGHFLATRRGTFQSVPRYPIPRDIELAHFIALIAAESLDGGGYRRIVVVGSDRRGELLPRVEVTASRFTSMSWAIGHRGSRCAIASGKKPSLADAILKLSNAVNDVMNPPNVQQVPGAGGTE
jgi:hypothetical protein